MLSRVRPWVRRGVAWVLYRCALTLHGQGWQLAGRPGTGGLHCMAAQQREMLGWGKGLLTLEGLMLPALAAI